MVKIVLGLLIMEYAVNLFLIMLGFRAGGVAPIVEKGQFQTVTRQVAATFVETAVDPLPQALVLTAIVISLGSLALMISICIRTYEKYGTFDITEIRRLKG
jgi:multicomponent Na+:H+ antiporter subunit C